MTALDDNKTKRYFMEHPLENWRLASKAEPEQFVRKYLSPYSGSVSNILDVGCGPGVIACAIAKAFSCSHVLAVDNSPRKIEKTHENMSGLTNLSAIIGDVSSLPLDANSFDIVFARFLLEYLSKPEHAVSEMVRVCRPGGRILLQDLDGQLVWHYPEDEGLRSGIEKVLNHIMAKTGFDPFVGRKLFHLLHSIGLTDIDVKVESYHLFAGRIDEKNFKLWKVKLDIAMPFISRILENENEALELKKAYLDYLQREDTLTYSVVFTVTGLKPPA